MKSVADEIEGIEYDSVLPPSKNLKVTYETDTKNEDVERFAKYVGDLQDSVYDEIVGGMFEVMQKQANRNAKAEVDAILEDMKDV